MSGIGEGPNVGMRTELMARIIVAVLGLELSRRSKDVLAMFGRDDCGPTPDQTERICLKRKIGHDTLYVSILKRNFNSKGPYHIVKTSTEAKEQIRM